MMYLNKAFQALEQELKIIGATIESKDQRIQELEEENAYQADLLKRMGRGEM